MGLSQKMPCNIDMLKGLAVLMNVFVFVRLEEYNYDFLSCDCWVMYVFLFTKVSGVTLIAMGGYQMYYQQFSYGRLLLLYWTLPVMEIVVGGSLFLVAFAGIFGSLTERPIVLLVVRFYNWFYNTSSLYSIAAYLPCC